MSAAGAAWCPSATPASTLWIAAVDGHRMDEVGGVWSISIYASPAYVNEPPADPVAPIGPALVYAGFERSYITSTIDPQGDDVCVVLFVFAAPESF